MPESVEIISSVMPSAKYESLGSGLMLAKGRTAILLLDLHWLSHILQRLASDALQRKFELVLHLIIDLSGQTYTAILRKRLYSRGHIHGIPIDVTSRLRNIAQVKADAEMQPSLVRQ